MAYTTLPTQSAGQTASAAGWANLVKADIESMMPHLLVRKTGDQTFTTGAFVDDTQLITPSIPANEVWLLEWYVSLLSTDGVYAIGITFPTNGSFNGAATGVTGERIMTNISTTQAQTATVDSNNTTPGMCHHVKGVYTAPGTAGVVTTQFKHSGATLTVKTHSTLWGVKLA